MLVHAICTQNSWEHVDMIHSVCFMIYKVCITFDSFYIQVLVLGCFTVVRRCFNVKKTCLNNIGSWKIITETIKIRLVKNKDKLLTYLTVF